MRTKVSCGVITILTLFGSGLCYTKNVKPEPQSLVSHRNAKVFLAMVKFNQDACTGTNGQTGVCMKRSQCTNSGGQDLGTCAQGFGVCCAVTQVCDPNPVVVNTNHVVLTPASSFMQFCRYEVPKQKGICQLRLDFKKFQISDEPDADTWGDCSSDTLTISGATNVNLGALCGNLDGQHMYLDYGTNSDISIDIYLDSNMNQDWQIEVTMIKCDSEDLAPTGCLQYFTESRGMVMSFNKANQNQLNNQDYSVCIRTNPGMRKITWKDCGGDEDFVISGVPPAFPAPGDPSPPARNYWSGDNCTNDWVMVYGINKYCGSGFAMTPAISMTQPFLLQVHFNEYELPIPPPQTSTPMDLDLHNTGFCLMYAQSPV